MMVRYWIAVASREHVLRGVAEISVRYVMVKVLPYFIPWRRKVVFLSVQEIAIEPLLDKLTFIKNKERWGFPFRRGLFEISSEDFSAIATAMGILHEHGS
jgi:hypothetical protein